MLTNLDTSSPYVIAAIAMVAIGVLLVIIALILALRWDIVGLISELSGRKKQKAVAEIVRSGKGALSGDSELFNQFAARAFQTTGTLPEFKIRDVVPNIDEVGAQKEVDLGREVSEGVILTGVLEDIKPVEVPAELVKDAPEVTDDVVEIDEIVESGRETNRLPRQDEGAIATGMLDEGVSENEGAVTSGVLDENNEGEGAITTGLLDESTDEGDITTGLLSKSHGESVIETGLLSQKENEAAIATGLLTENAGECAITTGLLTESQSEGTIQTGVLDENRSEGAITTGLLSESHEENSIQTGMLPSFNEFNITTGVLSDKGEEGVEKHILNSLGKQGYVVREQGSI